MASDPRAAISAAIPHRAPFLFVDRIVARSEGTIVTEFDVRADFDCFRGHYPGDPVLPGVLIAEFAFQSAALLLAEDAPAHAQRSGVPVLTKIEDARFKKIVRPGETLCAEIECVERVGPARYMRAHVTSNGQTVLEIRFTVASVSTAAPEAV